jgi:hypothetical protein
VEIILTADSIWATLLSMNPFYFMETANLHASIVNHGPDVLNNVVLSHRTMAIFVLCGPDATTFILNDLALASGDTATFSMPDVVVGYSYASSMDTLAEKTICMAVLAPDDRLDRFPEDNYSCSAISISYPVSVQDVAGDPQLKLYPNPVEEVLTLDLGDAASTTSHQMVIYDATGRLVLGSTLPMQQGPYQVDLSRLGNGAFILSLESGTRSLRTMIIKSQ